MATYLAVSSDIAGRIAAGELAAGDELLSVRSAALRYDTTTTTVARAYRHLAGAGVIEAAERRRSRVAVSGSAAARRMLAGQWALRLAGSENQAWRAFGSWEGLTMADVEQWLADVAGALDIPLDDTLPEETQSALLDLTGDIAHNVVRLAVPLSSYLIGVAVGRGALPRDAIAAVGALLADADSGTSSSR